MSDVVAAARLMRVAAENPEVELEVLLKKAAPESVGDVLLAVDFTFDEYWRDEPESVELTALFSVGADSGAIAVAVLTQAQFDACAARWRACSGSPDALFDALPVSTFRLDAAVPLQPVSIPKPWGREIWYTGIEQRGVVTVGAPGRGVPLPWLLAAAPRRLTGGVPQPILLKILDPLPEPVVGDLYFELHREKREVYVVTAVDRAAWPDGVGAIRFGFSAECRRRYADDRAFIAAYLAAVRDYRDVRRRIDARIDALRARDGIALNAPVDAATLARWMGEIAPELHGEEASLRRRMEAFTGTLPLRVGDVVKVPCLLPHSLQHGVRTVEFQTPVYERLILSFAQKVLTQADWDTEEAAAILQLDPEPPAPFPVTAQGVGWKRERIVVFDDFEVFRLTLEPGACVPLEIGGGPGPGYGLGIVVGQALSLADMRVEPDAAVLLPAAFHPAQLRNAGSETAYFLLALPLV